MMNRGERTWPLTMVQLIFLFAITLYFNVESTLPSGFYKPGPGVINEQWALTNRYYTINNFFLIPGYRSCPTRVENLEKFEWQHTASTDYYFHNRYRSYFVSPQSGNHKFFAICNYQCQVRLYELPWSSKIIINKEGHDSTASWSRRSWSLEMQLLKGFRYLIDVKHFGGSNLPDFFKLGVQFPDKTEVKPIDGRYLRRSMQFYSWNGFLMEKYSPISFRNFNITDIKQYNSAIYPDKPATVVPCRNLYDSRDENFANGIALRYTGYFYPFKSAVHHFKFQCNRLCDFTLNQSATENIYKANLRSGTSESIGRTSLLKGQSYYTEVFSADDYKHDYIRAQYKVADGDYRTDWVSHTRNLPLNETLAIVPAPTYASRTSTSLLMELSGYPVLPPKDYWTSSSMKYKIIYRKYNSLTPLWNMSLNGALPLRKNLTGLSKYTRYAIYAYYYGSLNGSYEYNVMSTLTYAWTDEDVPEDYPASLTASARSSTSIRLTWRPVANSNLRNGIIVGFELRYTVKRATSNWTSLMVDGRWNRLKTVHGLMKYTLYEFIVAARTSKGSGIFSPKVEMKTREDVPSDPPSNITARNTSSSSINVTWKEVAAEHQNGVIRGYKIYIRRSFRDGSWFEDTVPASARSYSKAGLELWVFYNVRVSAFTNVGEGVISPKIQVRTDEDKPAGPPQNLQARALSSISIKLQWSAIKQSMKNGIIISYIVTYEREDNRDTRKELVSNNRSIVISGLSKYVQYHLSVAGATRKGVGVKSLPIVCRTLQDVPSSYPRNVVGGFVNATAIRIKWGLIDKQERNGIITSYTVQYKLNDSNSEWKGVQVDSGQFSLTINHLRVFTLFEIRVAGATHVGIGPYSFSIIVRTDADGPTKAPSNLTGTFIDHRNISMSWSCVPEEFRSGIILGYKLMYKDGTNLTAPWINETIPHTDDEDCSFNTTLTNLKSYTPYIVKIAAYTYRAVGVFSDNVSVWTDEFIPEDVPKNITKKNVSSTMISFSWKDMKEIDGEANGQVLGYRIRYQVVDCHEDRPKGCNESEVFVATTTDAKPRITLSNLRKFTNYSISVNVFNLKGEGNFTYPIYVRTSEDRPDGSPTKLEAWPKKSDSITVFWNAIPESLRNGIILGYRVFYTPIDVPVRNHNRAPRSVNTLAKLGALAGEKMIEVNASVYELTIDELRNYSWYRIRIGAFTSIGFGVTDSINGTCKQGSPIKAPYFEIVDDYDFYELFVKWSTISRTSARGEVLGYRIKYWPIEKNDISVFSHKVSHIDVNAPILNLTIKNLKPYTKYAITISAFTEGGHGVSSNFKPGETCRCPKVLSSSWMRFPPLVNGKDKIVGLLPKFIGNAITECCDNCSRGQGPSYVDWTKDSLNSSAIKNSKDELRQSVLTQTHITVPIFRDTVEAEGNAASLYDYIPLVLSPGIVILKKRPTKSHIVNHGAEHLAESIFKFYPIFIISVFLTILAGAVFWILERGDNADEFPDDFFFGTGSGFWLAFITMTTAGYGDIAPKTKLGRIFAIIWTLIGIVITSILVGSIANALTYSVIVTDKTATVNSGKVLASNETFMLSIHNVDTRTVVGNTSDPYFVRNSLLAENVSKVVLEAFEASKFKDILQHPDIELEGIKKVDASYGITLSGAARRLKTCMQRYIEQNSQQMLMEFTNFTFTFESGESSNEFLTTNLLSSDADITIIIIQYGGISLLILVILGSIHDFLRRFRKRAKVADTRVEMERIFKEMDREVDLLVENTIQCIEKLDRKHVLERLGLTKMEHKDVRNIDPTLTMFDQTLQGESHRQRPVATIYAPESTSENNEEFGDSDYDHPMDFKMS